MHGQRNISKQQSFNPSPRSISRYAWNSMNPTSHDHLRSGQPQTAHRPAFHDINSTSKYKVNFSGDHHHETSKPTGWKESTNARKYKKVKKCNSFCISTAFFFPVHTRTAVDKQLFHSIRKNVQACGRTNHIKGGKNCLPGRSRWPGTHRTPDGKGTPPFFVVDGEDRVGEGEGRRRVLGLSLLFSILFNYFMQILIFFLICMLWIN